MNDEETKARTAFGERLRIMRISRKMSMRDLAVVSGVTINNISRIENGKYSAGFDVLYRLASSLACNIDVVEHS